MQWQLTVMLVNCVHFRVAGDEHLLYKSRELQNEEVSYYC
jgi:hypothetical protein